MRKLPTGSVVIGNLPKGCELCQRGLKTVIFVTGLCFSRCFYCPLSRERRRDVFLINEVKLSYKENDFTSKLIAEIYRSASLGASLTGGDPLVRPERTLKVIKILKEFFGEKFHIHMYTTGKSLNSDIVNKLEKAGLDELRIHPVARELVEIASVLKGSSLNYGLEIPSLPGKERDMLDLIRKAEKLGFMFVNINELEFSEENSIALLQRGYVMSQDYISAVRSKETAIRVMEELKKEGTSMDIHFCPVIIKDKYQTGLRHFRRGQIVAKPYEKVTDSGTLISLEVETDFPLKDIPRVLYEKRGKVLVTSTHLIPLLKDKTVSLKIVERQSSAEGLITYVEPIYP